MKNKLLLMILLWSQIAVSQNPVTEYGGVADPHIKVFNNEVYLYSGHDNDPKDRKFTMKDWRVFSTTNLVNWSLKTTISPKDNYMGANNIDCNASDAAEKNGKYYFYFSDESRGIGVMVSNSPAGPFKDALGKPLVAPMNDPTVLIDDDKAKTPYIVYGKKSGGGYLIAKLNNNMISLAETPKHVVINGEEWAKAPGFQDKNYLFKYKDTYYLSWGKNYAKSKNVYGPYECAGSVGKGYNLNAFAHGSFFWWKGQFYHVWCRYLDMAYKYRETIITYCHINDEGNIITDTNFLDQHFSNGVGQYNACWPKIEAEWYYEISGDINKQGNQKDGLVLTNIKDGNWIRFANVTFDKEFTKLVSNVFLKGQKGYIEVRIDSPKGNLLGKIGLASSAIFQEVSCQLKGCIGKKDVFLIFRGSKGSTLQLDWFKFKEQ